MDAASIPFPNRPESGGRDPAVPGPGPPGLREYDTGPRVGEGLVGGGLAGKGLAGEGLAVETAGALSALSAFGAARAGSARKGAAPGSPLSGGGFDPVTAGYPL
jgi:hypothetical protein